MRIESRLQQALTDFNRGDLQRAEHGADAVLAAVPNHPAAHQLMTHLCLARGDHEAAAGHIAICLAAQPSHLPTLLLAARVARLRGQGAQAAALAQRAIALAPQAVEPRLEMVLCRLDEDAGGAVDLLDDIVAAHPQSARAWFLLGVARRACGRFDDAVAAFEHACELDPRTAAGHVERGECLRALGRLRESEAALRRALGLEPEAAPIWYALGVTLQDNGDRGAAAAFEQALLLRPDFVEAAVNLGIARQDEGADAAAMTAFARAYRLRASEFGRIAQALSSGARGRLWLDLEQLRDVLAAG